MNNKRVKNSELAEWVFVAESTIHGKGVFASRDIKKGEYIGSYHGPVAKRNGTYVLWVFDPEDEEDCIGISGRNLLRYLNHQRPGNTEFDGVDLFACRNIKKNDELCFDYGEESGLD